MTPLPAADLLPVDLIIDCDPGVDDALALWLAAAAPERLRLLGVTCVSGNRPVEITTVNARRLLDAAGRPDVPVYAGAALPIGLVAARCNLVHGEDGLGGVDLPQQQPIETEHAVDFLVRALCNAPPNTVTLVAVGPLTNLALAEARHPGLLRRARSLLMMGGTVLHPGNVSPRAEFNFYADPAAAACVLKSVERLELYGLDVTSQVSMSPAWIESLGRLTGRCARAACAMLHAYATVDPLLHDACPVARLLEPSLFSGQPWVLQVVTEPGEDEGALRGSRLDGRAPAAGETVCEVMFEVDHARLLARVAERMALLP